MQDNPLEPFQVLFFVQALNYHLTYYIQSFLSYSCQEFYGFLVNQILFDFLMFEQPQTLARRNHIPSYDQI